MYNGNKRKFWIITIFAIAMAFLESAVVVYIRELYYNNGFSFPLQMNINPSLMNVEWVREFATIVMLGAVAYLASKKAYEKFAFFIYAFAIWDIFYYVFLKLCLNWPASIFDWDLLFLIPWAWVGPVITPIVCSLLFIILAVLIIDFSDKSKKEIKFSRFEWTTFIIAGIIVLYTWLCDFGAIIFSNGFYKSLLTLSTNQAFVEVVSRYIPVSYNWLLFDAAIVIAIIGVCSFYKRYKR